MARRHPGDISPIETLRRRLCLKIAERLEDHFDLRLHRPPDPKKHWDIDWAMIMIDSCLPIGESWFREAWDEIEREWQERESSRSRPKAQEPPRYMVRLREALGLPADHPLADTLEAAIKASKQSKP